MPLTKEDTCTNQDAGAQAASAEAGSDGIAAVQDEATNNVPVTQGRVSSAAPSAARTEIISQIPSNSSASSSEMNPSLNGMVMGVDIEDVDAMVLQVDTLTIPLTPRQGSGRTTPSGNSREISNIELVLFFASGLGSSLCYIATLSSLVYFMMMYNADSYIYLNLAVYIPLVPITILQALWDQHFDKIYRSYRTYLFRGVSGFVFSIFGTVLVPFQSTFFQLLVAATLQGIGGAVLLGTLNQMASFVETTSGKCKAAVSAGIQSSALVVLLLSVITGFGSDANGASLHLFFFLVLVLESMCFFMFMTLIIDRPQVAASMLRRDASLIALVPLLTPSSVVGTGDGSDNGSDRSNGRPGQQRTEGWQDEEITRTSTAPSSVSPDLTYTELLQSTWQCCTILIITLIPSFLVGSWFTQVKSDWLQLPQILFYTRIGSDFVGRIVTVLIPPRSIRCLGVTSLLRLIPVVFFFIISSTMQGDDHMTIFLVSGIAFLSGYLVTGSFQLAPKVLSTRIRDANVSKQASMLNVAFSISALGGLVASFVLVAIGVA